jgi:hypothetical protein
MGNNFATIATTFERIRDLTASDKCRALNQLETSKIN